MKENDVVTTKKGEFTVESDENLEMTNPEVAIVYPNAPMRCGICYEIMAIEFKERIPMTTFCRNRECPSFRKRFKPLAFILTNGLMDE